MTTTNEPTRLAGFASATTPNFHQSRVTISLIPEKRRLLPRLSRSQKGVNPTLLKYLDKLTHAESNWPLYLYGPTGTGKTCAALTMADIAETAAYWSLDDLADFVMEHSPSEVNAEFTALAQKWLVILDEIGTRERATDLHYRVLKRLADAREQNAGATIYISNLSPEQLAKSFDDRIASRLLCGVRFELTGEDRRFTR